jgi:hypothetical protein
VPRVREEGAGGGFDPVAGAGRVSLPLHTLWPHAASLPFVAEPDHGIAVTCGEEARGTFGATHPANIARCPLMLTLLPSAHN